MLINNSYAAKVLALQEIIDKSGCMGALHEPEAFPNG
jgi:hypothetical protein